MVDLLLQRRLLDQQRIIVGIGLGKLLIQRIEAPQQCRGLSHTLLDNFTHTLTRLQQRLLLEHPHPVARGQHRLTVKISIDSSENAQQRTLPRTIRPNHANLRPVEVGEANLLQHLSVRRVNLTDPQHRVDNFLIAHAATLLSGCFKQHPHTKTAYPRAKCSTTTASQRRGV